MNKPLLATYCTNKAIPRLTEEDIRLLDIVYIGFGRVDGTQVCLDELTNLKRMAGHPPCESRHSFDPHHRQR